LRLLVLGNTVIHSVLYIIQRYNFPGKFDEMQMKERSRIMSRIFCMSFMIVTSTTSIEILSLLRQWFVYHILIWLHRWSSRSRESIPYAERQPKRKFGRRTYISWLCVHFVFSRPQQTLLWRLRDNVRQEWGDSKERPREKLVKPLAKTNYEFSRLLFGHLFILRNFSSSLPGILHDKQLLTWYWTMQMVYFKWDPIW
jgi:hypothetical protein